VRNITHTLISNTSEGGARAVFDLLRERY